ncbi:MAG: hypothetical protein IKQ36_02390 [Clostridia bacterium]|nr:hypothetical protein [Clostridia bacterium]
MSIREWLRARKERREARRRERLERSAMPKRADLNMYQPEPELAPLEPTEPDIAPPESRYTDEYRDFINKREASQAGNNIMIEKN